MSVTIVDRPADRPEYLRETLALLPERVRADRQRLLGLVERASDAELGAGDDTEWGVGQIATHLLIVERGVVQIAVRLARGAPPGSTGQPRPAASAVSRAGIASLVEKVDRAWERAIAEFPAEPKVEATAVSPFYGPLNCYGWLLLIPFHYAAHLEALERAGKIAR